MPNPDGSDDVVEVEVLRPAAWAREGGVSPRARVAFGLPEMGLYGVAEVESAGPCPRIQPGPGRVVRATVTHLNGEGQALRLEGVAEVLEPTATHRLQRAGKRATIRYTHDPCGAWS